MYGKKPFTHVTAVRDLTEEQIPKRYFESMIKYKIVKRKKGSRICKFSMKDLNSYGIRKLSAKILRDSKVLLLLLMLLSFSSNAQDFYKYYSASYGYSSNFDRTVSLEAGCWGVKKPVMFGLSLDYVNEKQYWVGIKPYAEIAAGANYWTFFYFGPKVEVKSKDYLFEYGIATYSQMSKKWYASYGICAQSMGTDRPVPSIFLGINYVY